MEIKRKDGIMEIVGESLGARVALDPEKIMPHVYIYSVNRIDHVGEIGGTMTGGSTTLSELKCQIDSLKDGLDEIYNAVKREEVFDE